jgi:adenosylcobinamide kinase/adenosylcobinamide-phosphate guanylyltransferase
VLIYITGGARSGKSRHALAMAAKLSGKIAFVATCLPGPDPEMRARIERHKRERPRGWQTIENPEDLSGIYAKLRLRTGAVLIDCLTLYVSARLMKGETEPRINARIERFCRKALASKTVTIVVSNEVGSGLVPETALGRAFRDCAGRANQTVARRADRAVLMVSGLPVMLKGECRV